MISQTRTYKDLVFWQKAYLVARNVIGMCRKLPHDQISSILAKQIIRSATSIGANIAEGYGRYKGKEYERFLQIALGSAQETEHWLLLISDEFPSVKDKSIETKELTQEVIKMLIATLNKLRLSTNH